MQCQLIAFFFQLLKPDSAAKDADKKYNLRKRQRSRFLDTDFDVGEEEDEEVDVCVKDEVLESMHDPSRKRMRNKPSKESDQAVLHSDVDASKKANVRKRRRPTLAEETNDEEVEVEKVVDVEPKVKEKKASADTKAGKKRKTKSSSSSKSGDEYDAADEEEEEEEVKEDSPASQNCDDTMKKDMQAPDLTINNLNKKNEYDFDKNDETKLDTQLDKAKVKGLAKPRGKFLKLYSVYSYQHR